MKNELFLDLSRKIGVSDVYARKDIKVSGLVIGDGGNGGSKRQVGQLVEPKGEMRIAISDKRGIICGFDVELVNVVVYAVLVAGKTVLCSKILIYWSPLAVVLVVLLVGVNSGCADAIGIAGFV